MKKILNMLIGFFIFIGIMGIVFAGQKFVILDGNETKIVNGYEISNTKNYKIFAPYTDGNDKVLGNVNGLGLNKNLGDKLNNTYSKGGFIIKDANLEPTVICDEYNDTAWDGSLNKLCNNTINTEPDYNTCTAWFSVTRNNNPGLSGASYICDGSINSTCTVVGYGQTFTARFDNDCTITKITGGGIPSDKENVSVARGGTIGQSNNYLSPNYYELPYVWNYNSGNGAYRGLDGVYNVDKRCNAIGTFFGSYVPYKSGKCYYKRTDGVLVKDSGWWSPAVYDGTDYINSKCSGGTLNTLTRTFTGWLASSNMTTTSLVCVDKISTPPPVSGTCGSPWYNCSVGSLNNIPDNSNYFLRKCEGYNGGFDASCEYSKIQETCNETNIGLYNSVGKICGTTTNKTERCNSVGYTGTFCNQMWSYAIGGVVFWFGPGNSPTPRGYAYIWR